MKNAIILTLSVVTAFVIGSFAMNPNNDDLGVFNDTVYAEPDNNGGNVSANSESAETSNTNVSENSESAGALNTSADSMETAQKISLEAGQTVSFPFKVSNGADVCSIKILHTGNLNAEVISPSGLPNSDANIQQDGASTIINLVSPTSGEWKVNMTSDTAQEVSVANHIEYEIKIELTTSSNVAEVGTDKRYVAEIHGNSTVDLTALKVKLQITGNSGTDTKEMSYINGNYECTYKGNVAERKTMTVLVEYKNDTIESDPLYVNVIEGSLDKKNLSIMVLSVLIAVVLIAILAVLFKYRKKIRSAIELKPLEGSIYVSVIKNGVSESEDLFKLEEYGKSQTLYNIIKKRALLELQEIVISGLETGIKVVNKGGGRVRFSHVSSDPEGVLVRYGQAFKVFMSDNRTEVYVKYIQSEVQDETEKIEKKPLVSSMPVIDKLLSKFKKEKYALPEKEERSVYYKNAEAVEKNKNSGLKVDNSLIDFIPLNEPEEDNNANDEQLLTNKEEKPEEIGGENSEETAFNFIPLDGKENKEETENPFNFIPLDGEENKEEAENSFDFISLDGEENKEETENPFNFIPLDGEENKEEAENPFNFIPLDGEENKEEAENPFDFIPLDGEENKEEAENPFNFIPLDGEGDKEEAESPFNFVPLDGEEDKEEAENPFDFVSLDGEEDKEEPKGTLESILLDKKDNTDLTDKTDGDTFNTAFSDKQEIEKDEPVEFIALNEPVSIEEDEKNSNDEPENKEIPKDIFSFMNMGETDNEDDEDDLNDPFAFVRTDMSGESEESDDLNDPFSFIKFNEPAAEENDKSDVSDISSDDAEESDPFAFLNINEPTAAEENDKSDVLDISSDDAEESDPFAFLNINEPTAAEENDKSDVLDIPSDDVESSDPFAFLNINEPTAAEENDKSDILDISADDNEESDPFAFLNIDDSEVNKEVSQNIKDIDIPDFIGNKNKPKN